MKMLLPRLLSFCALVCALVVPAFGLPVPEVIYTWTLDPSRPLGMIQGSDGNFYGVTQQGGAANLGTIFKMTPAGVVTTLVEFTGNGATNKGGYPNGELIQASDGNFYGTTGGGGNAASGTVFKMTPTGQLTTLFEFIAPTFTNPGDGNGFRPMAGLVEGSDGNFYGTTAGSGNPPLPPGPGWINAPLLTGPPDNGTVFKITPAGALTTLVHFTSNGATNKGATPRAALVQGSDGDFYGTTSLGAANSRGTIFKMTSAGVLTTLAEIPAGAGIVGLGPSALVEGSDGNFYGTIVDAGTNGWGTAFRMTPAGVLTTLVEFTRDGPANKGSWPRAALSKGSDGNFYGTTAWGGTPSGGTVFKMTPSGVLTTLLEFTGSNVAGNKGASPQGKLTMGADGFIYGTTLVGGAGGQGTIFKMTPGGALTTLAEQYFARKGANPGAGLVQGGDGDFYGTTQAGGVENGGTVFKVTSAGVQTTLSSFVSIGMPGDGETPVAGLVQGADGSFYGSTQYAGTLGYGTLFKISSAGVRTTLVNFTSTGTTNRGANPQSELVLGSDGDFYGVTGAGGASGFGTVFKMTPGGVLTTLVEFTGNGATNKGKFPQGGLVQGSHGELYGTTSSGGSGDNGTIFKMTPNGVLTTLFEFPQLGQYGIGAIPTGTLAQGSDGNFYGTTWYGGAASYGTVFKMTPAGAVTTLAEFSGNGATNAGSYPANGVIQGSDGNFYGSTSPGGTEGLGTIFMMTPDGTLTTLMNLTRGPNQAYRIVQGNDGNLYGTISGGYSGGSLVGAGSVYRIAPVGTPIRRTMTTAASTAAGGSTSGGGNRYNGSRVTLVATPNTGYDFINWTEGGSPVSTSANYSFSATADRTLVANFALSSNANLVSLQPSGGTLSPVFASGTTNYKARVPFTTTSINLIPTSAHDGTSMQVNGENVISGTASGAITLNPGVNAITTSVTAPDGITTKIYVLTMTRESSPRDMNGDGKADLVFQNGAGQIAAWYMNGAGVNTSTVSLSTSALGDWKVKGVADMNGDGKADILFQNNVGQIVVWYLNGAGAKTSSGYLSTSALGDWRVVSVADMNNDGNADVIFQNNVGQIFVWYRNSSGTVASSGYLNTGALGDWRVAGVADMNNDGNADLIFQNTVGQVFAWYMNGAGTKTSSGYLNTAALGDWRVVGVADMNNDGNADLIFQNTSGQIFAWYMNGAGTKTSSGYLTTIALGDWRVR